MLREPGLGLARHMPPRTRAFRGLRHAQLIQQKDLEAMPARIRRADGKDESGVVTTDNIMSGGRKSRTGCK
jgi:hypothetical protein